MLIFKKWKYGILQLQVGCLFVCLFVFCLFVCLFVCLFGWLFVFVCFVCFVTSVVLYWQVLRFSNISKLLATRHYSHCDVARGSMLSCKNHWFRAAICTKYQF